MIKTELFQYHGKDLIVSLIYQESIGSLIIVMTRWFHYHGNDWIDHLDDIKRMDKLY